jgi:hypothetical protein
MHDFVNVKQFFPERKFFPAVPTLSDPLPKKVPRPVQKEVSNSLSV